MATLIPDEDLFDQGVLLLPHPLEYVRGDWGPGYVDADPHLVYDSGDGFARFETGKASIALYRRITADAIRAKIRFQHKRVAGTAGATRYTGLLLRARGTLVASATAGQTDYVNGLTSGYLIEVIDNGVSPIISAFRIVGGGATLLVVTPVTVAENTWHTLEARIQTNSSGNVEIAVLFNGSVVTNMGPLTDSSAFRVLTAGAVGLRGTAVDSGGNTVRSVFDYFQAVSFDGSETLLEDDFQRPNTVLVTAGGKVHASLMWEFGDAEQIANATGSVQAPGYQGGMLAVDPGNPAAGFIGPWIDLYQRTPASANQSAGMRFRFDGAASAAQHEAGLVLRGSKSAVGTGSGNFTGYALILRLLSGGVNAMQILRFNTGTKTVLAQRNWTVQPDRWYDLEVEGEVVGADYRLTIRTGQNGLMLNALQFLDTSPVGPTGLQGLWGRMSYAGGAAGRLLVANWYASAIPAPAASIDPAPILVPTEELTVRHEYLEDQVKEWPQIRIPFETRHVQTYPAMRQGVTVWTAEWLAQDPDATTVLEFLRARAADALPFLITASTGQKAMRLVSDVIPFEAVDLALFKIGPVEMIEYISPDSVP